MSIKLTVDNNFFDNYEKYPNDKDKELVRKAFINRRLSFYPSLQLIAELISLYQTKRKHVLPKYSTLFLEMIGCRCLNDWNRIIRSELGLMESESIFLNSVYVKRIKDIFRNLSRGRISTDVKSVLGAVALDKKTGYEAFKKNQEKHFKLLKDQNIKTPKMNFDDFYKANFAVQIRKDLVKDLFKRANKSITDDKIDKIVDNPINYPYFYVSSRVFMGIFYRHIVLRRRVDEGDSYDQYYLIYLTNLDYLVTEDIGLSEFGKDVFGKEKVINLNELVKISKVETSTK